MSFHPYVARVCDNQDDRKITRGVARSWDVIFLVKSESMLTSNVLYVCCTKPEYVFLQRVPEMDFDVLDAVEVPRMSGDTFMQQYRGITCNYTNDNGSTIFITGHEIQDANKRALSPSREYHREYHE